MWKQLITPLRFSPGPGYDSVFTSTSKPSMSSNGTAFFGNGLSNTVSCRTFQHSEIDGVLSSMPWLALVYRGSTFISSCWTLSTAAASDWHLNSVVAGSLESPCPSTWLCTSLCTCGEQWQAGQNDVGCPEKSDCTDWCFGWVDLDPQSQEWDYCQA